MPRPKVMKEPFYAMLRDLKAVYTDAWFLPADAFKSQAEAWYKALSDISYDYLKGAFDEWIRTSAKPPAPSEIRDIALRHMYGAAEGMETVDPLEQWTYWVLLDLNGHHINEVLASKEKTADDIRQYLTSRGYPENGTVLKAVDYKNYHPKYQEVTS